MTERGCTLVAGSEGDNTKKKTPPPLSHRSLPATGRLQRRCKLPSPSGAAGWFAGFHEFIGQAGGALQASV